MEDLTKIYSPSCWVPGICKEEVLNNFLEEIEKSKDDLQRSGIPRNLDIPYGDEESQKLDIWGEVNDKMLIFLHGGYWIEGTRKDTLPVSRIPLSHGFAFASIGYRLATNGAKLHQTIGDAVAGVEFLLRMFPNVKSVVIGGHSAGAHLAVHVVNRLRDSRLCGLVLFSGIYNLEEIPKTEMGRSMGLSREEAEQHSCDLIKLNDFEIRKLVILGLEESPIFVKQNRKFAREVNATRIWEFEHESHFTIISSMARKDSPVSSAVLRFLGTI